MTNILIDKLPTEYEGLKVDTNFRSFILFELLMQDNEINKEDKVALALNLFYDTETLKTMDDIKKATKGILWFYTMGKSEDKKASNGNNKSKKQIYSYEYDAEYIYSAFLDQYGIDLNEVEYLHWFKFKSMFNALKSDNKICEIMGYRAINTNKIKDKEEQKRYRKLQKEWALPDNRTQEEKEQDFANAFW